MKEQQDFDQHQNFVFLLAFLSRLSDTPHSIFFSSLSFPPRSLFVELVHQRVYVNSTTFLKRKNHFERNKENSFNVFLFIKISFLCFLTIYKCIYSKVVDNE